MAWKEINVSVGLTADVQIVVSHARSTISSKMLNQAKLTPIRMTSAQFNLYFEANHQEGNHNITFLLKDLDDIDELDRFPHDFKINVNFDIVFSDSKLNLNDYDQVSQNEIVLLTNPECIFSNNSEFEEFKEMHGLTEAYSKAKQKPPTRPPPPAVHHHST